MTSSRGQLTTFRALERETGFGYDPDEVGSFDQTAGEYYRPAYAEVDRVLSCWAKSTEGDDEVQRRYLKTLCTEVWQRH